MRGKPKKGYTVGSSQSADTLYPLIGSLPRNNSLDPPPAALRLFPRAIKILSFQNFYEVLKTCSAGRKDFFDTLKAARSGRPSCLRRLRGVCCCIDQKKSGSQRPPSIEWEDTDGDTGALAPDRPRPAGSFSGGAFAEGIQRRNRGELPSGSPGLCPVERRNGGPEVWS